MCYLVAKKFNDVGCLALQMTHGQHLADFKEKLMRAVGYDTIQPCDNKPSFCIWGI